MYTLFPHLFTLQNIKKKDNLTLFKKKISYTEPVSLTSFRHFKNITSGF
jgi:hypothetical protein